MPRAAKPLLSLACLALATSCATMRANIPQEEATLRDLNRRWVATVPARDAATWASMYADDGVQISPTGEVLRGPDEIRRAMAEFMNSPNLQLTFAPTRINVSAAGDLATELGTYQLAFDGPQGRVEDHGSYVTNWRKRDGQWRAITDIATSSKPAPMAAQATTAPTPMATTISFEGDRAEMAGGTGLIWSAFAIPGFPPGARRTVIHGDPTKEGDFTLRLSFPDGYRIPPHVHTAGEHITVLQGTFMFGMGERFDESALKAHPAGDFIYTPAKMPHFAIARGETIVQLHGTGPWTVKTVGQP